MTSSYTVSALSSKTGLLIGSGKYGLPDSQSTPKITMTQGYSPTLGIISCFVLLSPALKLTTSATVT